MPANPAFRGAYRSRTGVSVVTKDSAQSPCVEPDSVRRDFADAADALTALAVGPGGIRLADEGAVATRELRDEPHGPNDFTPAAVLVSTISYHGLLEPPEGECAPETAWLSGSQEDSANIAEEGAKKPLEQAEPTREIIVLEGAEAEAFAARERVSQRGLDAETCLRLVGITEGEGHFGIVRLKPKTKSWRCVFVIKLRADDRALLEGLREATGLGRIGTEATPTRHNPCVRWEVAKKDELDQLADIFRAYPLRSKKARDAAIWMEALDEWLIIGKGDRGTDWSRMAELARDLREVRKFNLTSDDIALLDSPADALHERLNHAVSESGPPGGSVPAAGLPSPNSAGTEGQ